MSKSDLIRSLGLIFVFFVASRGARRARHRRAFVPHAPFARRPRERPNARESRCFNHHATTLSYATNHDDDDDDDGRVRDKIKLMDA